MSILRITGIQTSLHWEDKLANLKMFREKIFSIDKPSHLIILPEMFSTGFSMNPSRLAEPMNGDTIQWMKAVAAEKRSVLTGSLIIEEGEEYFNRLIWMLPTGQVGYYDKRHLFAYGGEDAHYFPGERRLITSINGWRILMLVCYDLRFPVWARQQSMQEGLEYDAIVYVANWPERRVNAWKTLLQARAIENQCYVIGVNRVGKDGNDVYHSGDSMVVDPMGEILYHKSHDEDIFTVELDREHLNEVRRKLPFWKDSDQFEIMI